MKERVSHQSTPEGRGNGARDAGKEAARGYAPWGRRDRSCSAAEALSRRVMAVRILLRLSWRRLTSRSVCSLSPLSCSTLSLSSSIRPEVAMARALLARLVTAAAVKAEGGVATEPRAVDNTGLVG